MFIHNSQRPVLPIVGPQRHFNRFLENKKIPLSLNCCATTRMSTLCAAGSRAPTNVWTLKETKGTWHTQRQLHGKLNPTILRRSHRSREMGTMKTKDKVPSQPIHHTDPLRINRIGRLLKMCLWPPALPPSQQSHSKGNHRPLQTEAHPRHHTLLIPTAHHEMESHNKLICAPGQC